MCTEHRIYIYIRTNIYEYHIPSSLISLRPCIRVQLYIYIRIYMYVYIYCFYICGEDICWLCLRLRKAAKWSKGRKYTKTPWPPGPCGLGPYGPAVMGRASMGPPWALMGRALRASLGPYRPPWALMRIPGHVWAGPSLAGTS